MFGVVFPCIFGKSNEKTRILFATCTYHFRWVHLHQRWHCPAPTPVPPVHPTLPQRGPSGPELVRSPKTFCRSFHLLWRARMMWDIRCQKKNVPPKIRFLFHRGFCRNVGCWLCFAGTISACFEIESPFLRLETCKTIQITCPTSTGVEFLSSTVNLSGHWTKPLPFDSRYRYFKIHGFCLVPDRRVKALFCCYMFNMFNLFFPKKKNRHSENSTTTSTDFWFLNSDITWKNLLPPLLTVCCYFFGRLRLVKHHQLFTSDQLTKTDSFVAMMPLKHVDQRMLMYFEVDLPMFLIHLFIIDININVPDMDVIYCSVYSPRSLDWSKGGHGKAPF